MNCDRCGERPGVIRFTEYDEGTPKLQSICLECAGALGFGERAESEGEAAQAGPIPEPALEEDAGDREIEDVAVTSPIRSDRRCPSCGLTGADFGNESLFGCPHCYEAFDDDLDLLLKRLHGATTHRGRVPLRSEASPSDESDLRRELTDALEARDFERAAKIRDRLRASERGLPPRPPPASGGAR